MPRARSVSTAGDWAAANGAAQRLAIRATASGWRSTFPPGESAARIRPAGAGGKPPSCAARGAALTYGIQGGAPMFTKASADDLRAVLSAYRLVKNSSWRELHPAMDRRAPYWASSTEADLAAELTEYLKESIAPGCGVRVFWKLGPKLLFCGCNEHFASDAGVPSSELMGMDDFDD